MKLFTIKDLQLQIQKELGIARQLEMEIRQAEADLSVAQAQFEYIQQYQQLDTSDMIKEQLAATLNNLRNRNISSQRQIEQLKVKIEKTKAKTAKKEEEIKKVSIGGTKEKYARVMDALSNYRNDLRNWDSQDILDIDDTALGQGISYEEAKDIVEGKINTIDFESLEDFE